MITATIRRGETSSSVEGDRFAGPPFAFCCWTRLLGVSGGCEFVRLQDQPFTYAVPRSRAASPMGERGSVARRLGASDAPIRCAHGEYCLIVEFGLPAGAMEEVMVETAKQYKSVKVGMASRDPVVDVVDIAPARWAGAAWRPTVVVAGDHRSAQWRGNAANCSAEFEYVAPVGNDPL